MSAYGFSTIWDENVNNDVSEKVQWYLAISTTVRVMRLADFQPSQALVAHVELKKLSLSEAKEKVNRSDSFYPIYLHRKSFSD